MSRPFTSCSQSVCCLLLSCRARAVPFIPELTEDLKTFVKKDSLWYSHDLRTVPDRDPQVKVSPPFTAQQLP